MEIIIVRHGESEANRDKIVGYPEAPLTDKGEQQALDLAKRLKGLEIEAVYTSTMRRAMDTAKPFSSQAKKEIIADARLDEVRMGKLEKMPDTEAEAILGTSIRDLFNLYEYDFSKWDGETSQEVKARVQDFLNDLKKQPHSLVLIICHGGIVRWINYILTGEKIGPQPNAEELTLKTQEN